MRSFFLVCALAIAGCGAREIPPPATPTPSNPPNVDLPDGPAATGLGRVILDTPGQKAKVVEVVGVVEAHVGNYAASSAMMKPVCTTPCVVDSPLGTHHYVVASTTDPERISTAEVEVTARPKWIRHELGRVEKPGPTAYVGAPLVTLGGLTALIGATMWGVGAMNDHSGTSGKESSLVGAGQATTLIGLGAVAIGIPLLILGRGSIQPGATGEFTAPSTPSKNPEADGVKMTMNGFTF